MACCSTSINNDSQWIGSKSKGAIQYIYYFSHVIKPIKLVAPNLLVFSSDPLVKSGSKIILMDIDKAPGVIGLNSCAGVTVDTSVANGEYTTTTDLNFVVTAAGGTSYELPKPVTGLVPPRSRLSSEVFSIGVCSGNIDTTYLSGRVFTGSAECGALTFSAKCNCCLEVSFPASLTSVATFPKGKKISDPCGSQSYCYEIINSAPGAVTSVIRGELIL